MVTFVNVALILIPVVQFVMLNPSMTTSLAFISIPTPDPPQLMIGFDPCCSVIPTVITIGLNDPS